MPSAWSAQDQEWMRLALARARVAAGLGEVPVGAVVVCGDQPVGAGHNLRETRGDPTAHAEVLAVREAASTIGHWRLDGCTVYVTLEPCIMCAGALWLARVERLVFATHDPKAGAAGSLYNVPADARLNHRLRVEHGLMGEESGALIREFFRDLRRRRRPDGVEGCPSG